MIREGKQRLGGVKPSPTTAKPNVVPPSQAQPTRTAGNRPQPTFRIRSGEYPDELIIRGLDPKRIEEYFDHLGEHAPLSAGAIADLRNSLA